MLGRGLTETSCFLFERIQEVVKHEQDKPFIWKSRVDGAISWVGQSLGISKAEISVSWVD